MKGEKILSFKDITSHDNIKDSLTTNFYSLERVKEWSEEETNCEVLSHIIYDHTRYEDDKDLYGCECIVPWCPKSHPITCCNNRFNKDIYETLMKDRHSRFLPRYCDMSLYLLYAKRGKCNKDNLNIMVRPREWVDFDCLVCQNTRHIPLCSGRSIVDLKRDKVTFWQDDQRPFFTNDNYPAFYDIKDSDNKNIMNLDNLSKNQIVNIEFVYHGSYVMVYRYTGTLQNLPFNIFDFDMSTDKDLEDDLSYKKYKEQTYKTGVCWRCMERWSNKKIVECTFCH
jgi:hypothetical protein